MAQQDYYAILGVDPHDDAKKIKEAYRELAFRYHPDRNAADPDSVEMMKRINEAYAVLSHPQKRREYDALRLRFGENAYGQFRNAYTEQEIFRGSDIHQIFEEMARSFGLRGVDAIFRDFYGTGYQRFEFKKNGLHGQGFIFRGGFGGPRKKSPLTEGHMPLPGGGLTRFLLRRLTGVALPQAGADIHDTIVMTPAFAHAGGPYPYYHRRRGKKLVVSIPAGTREGQQIRLARMGAEGRDGGEAGDLYLEVRFKAPFLKKAKDFIVSALGR